MFDFMVFYLFYTNRFDLYKKMYNSFIEMFSSGLDVQNWFSIILWSVFFCLFVFFVCVFAKWYIGGTLFKWLCANLSYALRHFPTLQLFLMLRTWLIICVSQSVNSCYNMSRILMTSPGRTYTPRGYKASMLPGTLTWINT